MLNSGKKFAVCATKKKILFENKFSEQKKTP